MRLDRVRVVYCEHGKSFIYTIVTSTHCMQEPLHKLTSGFCFSRRSMSILKLKIHSITSHPSIRPSLDYITLVNFTAPHGCITCGAPCIGNVNEFRLHNNSGKQTTSSARQKMGKDVEYIKYDQEGRNIQLKEMFRDG